jgi:XRE family transcriptional regulator, regulator of sulfur utilization
MDAEGQPWQNGHAMPVSSLSKPFGQTVRRRRMAAGFSQEKLAEQAGLHPTYISMIERGVRNATLDTASRIAKALKMSLPRLIEQAQQTRGNAATANVLVRAKIQAGLRPRK